MCIEKKFLASIATDNWLTTKYSCIHILTGSQSRIEQCQLTMHTKLLAINLSQASNKSCQNLFPERILSSSSQLISNYIARSRHVAKCAETKCACMTEVSLRSNCATYIDIRSIPQEFQGSFRRIEHLE